MTARAAALPLIKVFLDTATFTLSWKRADVKGCRWQGRCASIMEVSTAADRAGVPLPREFDYVDRQT